MNKIYNLLRLAYHYTEFYIHVLYIFTEFPILFLNWGCKRRVSQKYSRGIEMAATPHVHFPESDVWMGEWGQHQMKGFLDVA